VFLCRDKEQARRGFESLIRQPQFGGGINEAVLIQVCSEKRNITSVQAYTSVLDIEYRMKSVA
jgi:hypothetical protein